MNFDYHIYQNSPRGHSKLPKLYILLVPKTVLNYQVSVAWDMSIKSCKFITKLNY